MINFGTLLEEHLLKSKRIFDIRHGNFGANGEKIPLCSVTSAKNLNYICQSFQSQPSNLLGFESIRAILYPKNFVSAVTNSSIQNHFESFDKFFDNLGKKLEKSNKAENFSQVCVYFSKENDELWNEMNQFAFAGQEAPTLVIPLRIKDTARKICMVRLPGLYLNLKLLRRHIST